MEAYRQAVLLFPIIGLVVGMLWIRHISKLGEDPDLSFSRLTGWRGGGSSLPDITRFADNTRGWYLTRGAIAIGVASVVIAVVGPLVLRRWDRAFDLGPLAVAVWVTAIALAVIGTAWAIRIAMRAPDAGSTGWRYRR